MTSGVVGLGAGMKASERTSTQYFDLSVRLINVALDKRKKNVNARATGL